MTRPTHQLSKYRNSSLHFDPIEWEELPSLVDSLSQRGQPLGMNFGSPWVNTLPSDLIDLPEAPPSAAFSETLQGLQTREVHEPDVFRHFFG